MEAQLKNGMSRLDGELGKLPFMLHLERQSGIPKVHLFLAAVAAFLSLLLSLIIPELLMASLIITYPLLSTIRAIDGMSRQEHVQWLGYWAIQAIMLMLEQLSFGRLAQLLPHYALIKTAFSVWMWMPTTGALGATRVYDVAIRPLILMAKNACSGSGGQKIGKPPLNDKKPNSPLSAKVKVAEPVEHEQEEEKEDDKDK